MKSFNIELKVGDKINLGRFKNVRSEIKDIKVDEYGQPLSLLQKAKRKH